MTTGHIHCVFAVNGLVVGELGFHFHGLCAHVGDGRRRGAPCCAVVSAVGDGRRLSVAGGCLSCRLEFRAVVHLGDVVAARTGQGKAGGVGGDFQFTFNFVYVVIAVDVFTSSGDGI